MNLIHSSNYDRWQVMTIVEDYSNVIGMNIWYLRMNRKKTKRNHIVKLSWLIAIKPKQYISCINSYARDRIECSMVIIVLNSRHVQEIVLDFWACIGLLVLWWLGHELWWACFFFFAIGRVRREHVINHFLDIIVLCIVYSTYKWVCQVSAFRLALKYHVDLNSLL